MQCEQKEQHAEHVLALRHPRDRFDVQRMQRKQRCYRQTRPGQSGRILQQQKQQHHIRRMQQKIDVMVPRGIKPKNLAIERMRQPRHRMPVSRMKRGERPLQRLPVQAALHLRILQNVNGVVKIGELIARNGVIESERSGHQQQAPDGDTLLVRN